MQHRFFTGKRSIFVLTVFALLSFAWFQPKKIKVYLIGDSTMCLYTADRFPITGWGMPFANYFDQTITIDNRAKGGRSTRTFLSENRWKPIADSIEKGDFVLMQFGHNDEAKEPKYADRYTPVPDYKKNLTKFITETRNKKGIPVLVTPVSRRSFDSAGNIKETHKEYSKAVYEIGEQLKVPVIDLDKKSRELFQAYGPENSKLLFMDFPENVEPNYPKGQHDNTHFNNYGARKIAELVLAEIDRLHLSLADHIVHPANAKK
jgi:lysophospholipase L1-like esterase